MHLGYQESEFIECLALLSEQSIPKSLWYDITLVEIKFLVEINLVEITLVELPLIHPFTQQIFSVYFMQ